MVGGYIIDIFDVGELVRLWVYDPSSFGELCVVVARSEVMPKLRDNIWWQGGKVYFNDDKNWLEKVGNSYDPRYT